MLGPLRREPVMKISARNQIPGTIVAITPGAVNGTVKVDIGNGVIVTSSITEEAIADLALAEGDRVIVLVKASDVLIGK
jgi:molybdopterin-binding protein